MKQATALSVLAVATLVSAQPKITDAKLETRSLPAGGSLAKEAASGAPRGASWLAWRIATVPNSRQMCCSSDRCAWGCSLADGNFAGGTNCAAVSTKIAHLEGYREAFVFVRVEDGRVNRIRTFSPDCQIDAGGLPVILLNDVPAPATLAYLKTFVNWDSGRLAERAVDAIGLLPEPDAVQALEQYLTGNQPRPVRRSAAIALGQFHAQRAVPKLTRLLKEDPDPQIREHCLYALSLSKQGTGVLLDIANRKVATDRKALERAVFWLARSQEPEARRYIDAVLSR